MITRRSCPWNVSAEPTCVHTRKVIQPATESSFDKAESASPPARSRSYILFSCSNTQDKVQAKSQTHLHPREAPAPQQDPQLVDLLRVGRDDPNLAKCHLRMLPSSGRDAEHPCPARHSLARRRTGNKTRIYYIYYMYVCMYIYTYIYPLPEDGRLGAF